MTAEITNNFLTEINDYCPNSTFTQGTGTAHIITDSFNNIMPITGRGIAPSSCVIVNRADLTVGSIIDGLDLQETTAISGIMGDIGESTTTHDLDITTSLKNNISQIMTQACGSNINSDFKWVQTGGTTGYRYIDRDSNAGCIISNLSKIDAYYQSQSNSKIVSTNTTTSMIAMIGIGIVVVILIAGLIYVLLYSKGTLGNALSPDPINKGSRDSTTVNKLSNENGGITTFVKFSNLNIY